MELKIDLNKERKKEPIREIVYGVFWLLLGFFNFFIKKNLNTSDWILIGSFALLSILYFIKGIWGYSFTLGKSYIQIDSKSILAKTKNWGKKQFVNWDDVKSIIYDNEFSLFKIEKMDNETITIDLSEYNEILVSKVEQAIDSITKEKNILATKIITK